MHKSTRGNQSKTTAEPPWTKQEDDLLLSLLHTTLSGIRCSGPRRPWKDIAVDMNAEALRLGLRTRFFHHEKIRRRWLRFGQFYAVAETPEEEEEREEEEDEEERGETSDAPLQDLLARVGVEAFNGQLLSPPVQRGSGAPRPARGADARGTEGRSASGAGGVSVSAPRTPRIPVLGYLDRRRARVGNGGGSAGGGTSGDANARAFVDGKGRRVARDLSKSWLF